MSTKKKIMKNDHPRPSVTVKKNVKDTHVAQSAHFFQVALNHHQKDDLVTAINYYSKAIEVNSGEANNYYYCALALRDIGQKEKACEYLQRTIALNPTHVKAYYDLGVLYLQAGRRMEALSCNLQAIENDPSFMDAHTNLDCILDLIDKPELEMACYKKLLASNRNIYSAGPRRIRIETSSACNLRCQHCPTGTFSGEKTRKIMDMKMFDLILGKLKKTKILNDCVFYIGGEPLLNKKLPLMCKRIKEETTVTYTHFTTNAMLIDEEKCRALRDANLNKIIVSIDGRSPEENDRIRLGANYNMIKNNVALLRKYLPNVQVVVSNVIIKQANDPDVPAVPEFLLEDFAGVEISTLYAMKWPGLKVNNSSLENLVIEQNRPRNFCKLPFTEMGIKANGDITLCCYDLLGENVMGNVLHDDLIDIWNGDAYRNLRQNMLNMDVELLPSVCRKCKNYSGEMLLSAA